MKELVLGCGHYRKKRIYHDSDEYVDPFFIDNDPSCIPDIVFDLNEVTVAGGKLPFKDNEFDEIHAYDVLEHIGRQGDIKRFFREFSEYYRVLKSDGLFFITCPNLGKWAWGDPGHTRVITKETITYLSQDAYAEQVGITQMSDYRYYWRGNFKLIDHQHGDNADSDSFILRCIK